jgi:hypothetical protein
MCTRQVLNHVLAMCMMVLRSRSMLLESRLLQLGPHCSCLLDFSCSTSEASAADVQAYSSMCRFCSFGVMAFAVSSNFTQRHVVLLFLAFHVAVVPG